MKTLLVVAVQITILQVILARRKKSLSPFDEGCTVDKPARCPRLDPSKHSADRDVDKAWEGKCSKSYAECNIAHLCTNPEAPYQCPEGACVNAFRNCPVKKHECAFNE